MGEKEVWPEASVQPGGAPVARTDRINVRLWSLDPLLQVAMGPVLEEILFRGYLMRLLLWSLKGVRPSWAAPVAAVMFSAGAFGTIHLLRPGTEAVTAAVIAGVGVVYGYIRVASGSTAPAAVAHAVYSVTLYVGMAL